MRLHSLKPGLYGFTMTVLVAVSIFASLRAEASCYQMRAISEDMAQPAGERGATENIFTGKLLDFKEGKPVATIQVEVLESFKGALKAGDRISAAIHWTNIGKYSMSRPNLFVTSKYNSESINTDHYAAACSAGDLITETSAADAYRWLQENRAKVKP